MDITVKNQAQEGDAIQGDCWKWAEPLVKDNSFKDAGFPGCQFRVAIKNMMIAVNVQTTGRPKWNGHRYQSRCRIEFVGDCEPSTFTGGTLYHSEY